jgi:hypothetical protein
VIERLRHVPQYAYWFLAVSMVGAIVELSYHFLPPDVIPLYGSWLASLSPADRDFFGLTYELIAHIFIAVGLFGMVAVYLYQQLESSK